MVLFYGIFPDVASCAEWPVSEDMKEIGFTVGFKVELKMKKLPKIEKLTEKLGKLFAQENEFADVKIICDGRTFECHKLVLSCQSEVFKGKSLLWQIVSLT